MDFNLLYKGINAYQFEYIASTGCPKSKVTILIFNNFLMKEVV